MIERSNAIDTSIHNASRPCTPPARLSHAAKLGARHAGRARRGERVRATVTAAIQTPKN
jgi:hypothetical protein